MIGAKRLNFKPPLFFDVPARLAMPIAVHPSWRMDFVIDGISRAGPVRPGPVLPRIKGICGAGDFKYECAERIKNVV